MALTDPATQEHHMALANALEARTVNTARSPAIIYPGSPVSASGQGALALTVSPSAAGNLLMLVFGSGGAGKVSALSSAVSGGGVTQWKRTAGRLDTADHQLVEVWSGVVTTPGQSAVTVHCPSAAAEWNRFWALELSASGAAPAWLVTAAGPVVTAASPSGTGSAVTYPAAPGPGLYLGAAIDSWGALAAGSSAGFAWATVDGHLQVAWKASGGSTPPVSSSTNTGEHWNTIAVLVSAVSTPVPLSASAGSLPPGLGGQAYSGGVTAAGGRPPYAWSLAGGSLPPGLSLSSQGIVSGTPAAAGTSPFTVAVTDAANTAATAKASITVTAAPPVLFTGTYPPNTHATFTAAAPDPRLSLAGVTRDPYMDVNVWSPEPLETIKSTVWNVRNWAVAVSVTNPSGGVTCFPNTAAYPISVPWSTWDYFISGWNELMDDDPVIIASACYDNWFDSTLISPTGQAINEVMLHFDFRNRGAGPWSAQGVQFGGYTVNGVAIPVTRWNLAAAGGAVFWNLVDAGGSITSLPAGAVDMLAMNKWLVANGWLSADCNMTGFSIGYEICHTAGAIASFQYNDLWWSAGTT